MVYDPLGRPTQWTNADGKTILRYDGAQNGKGLLERVTGPAGDAKAYSYNPSELPSTLTTTLAGGASYVVAADYDALLRPSVLYYPTVDGQSFAVDYVYDSAGNLTELRDHYAGVSLWKVVNANPFGQITDEVLGGLYRTSYGYEDGVPRLSSILTWDAAGTMPTFYQSLTFDYDANGNLEERAIIDPFDPSGGTRFTWQTFGYDALQRIGDQLRSA
jgi:hypothetical protein